MSATALPGLRRHHRRVSGHSWESRIAWPPGAAFVLSYLGVFGLFCVSQVVLLGPFAYSTSSLRNIELGFYQFWHQELVEGISLLTGLMACNTLMLLYVWVSWRRYGRRDLGKRLFFLSSALVLVTLQWLYWRLGTVDPPVMRLLELPREIFLPPYP